MIHETDDSPFPDLPSKGGGLTNPRLELSTAQRRGSTSWLTKPVENRPHMRQTRASRFLSHRYHRTTSDELETVNTEAPGLRRSTSSTSTDAADATDRQARSTSLQRQRPINPHIRSRIIPPTDVTRSIHMTTSLCASPIKRWPHNELQQAMAATRGTSLNSQVQNMKNRRLRSRDPNIVSSTCTGTKGVRETIVHKARSPTPSTWYSRPHTTVHQFPRRHPPGRSRVRPPRIYDPPALLRQSRHLTDKSSLPQPGFRLPT